MSTILVAGATGYLGRFIIAKLHRRGYQVRALVRDLGRAEAPGPYGSPGDLKINQQKTICRAPNREC